jgi:hypothetical protein
LPRQDQSPMCKRLMVPLLLVLANLPLPCQADYCADGHWLELGRELGYTGEQDGMTGPSNCKVLPDDPTRAVIALTRPVAAEGTADRTNDVDVYRLDLLIVNTGTGDVISRWSDAKYIVSDAFRFASVDIDTAAYRLAPGVRAFGIATRRYTNSHVIDAQDSVLTLFVATGKTIRPVLRNLIILERFAETTDFRPPQFIRYPWCGDRTAGDGPDARSGTGGARTPIKDAEYPSRERRTIIQIGTRAHQGFADLVLRTTAIEGETRLYEPTAAEDCIAEVTTTRTSHKRYVLRYNGVKYLVPRPLLHELDD